MLFFLTRSIIDVIDYVMVGPVAHQPSLFYAAFERPRAAQRDLREGVAAWQTLQQRLRELAQLNKERARARAKETRSR